ncbi:hypothetical protein HOD30_03715 [Candidatus Peregrinibacteria bacterium]|jgi:hypothetical protein|nr:hypothetical protein [Candidatus Peregrinibacteria bacterium]MBT4632366.1 hypothetical protein [Candidatus Peregrinibacteria bacterium]
MQELSTSDWGLILVLSYLNFTCTRIDRNNPNRVEFCFEQNKKLDEAIAAFWRGDLRVEPRKFLMQQKLLKSRLHSDF